MNSCHLHFFRRRFGYCHTIFIKILSLLGNRIKVFHTNQFLTLTKPFLLSNTDSSRVAHTVHHLQEPATMADSSSAPDQTTQSSFLTIKPNQYLILDLAPFKYDSYMLPIVECLKYSPWSLPWPKQSLFQWCYYPKHIRLQPTSRRRIRLCLSFSIGNHRLWRLGFTLF